MQGGQNKGLKEIRSDIDALTMAMSAGSSKEVHVRIMIANEVSDHGVTPNLEEEEEGNGEESDLEDILIEVESRGEKIKKIVISMILTTLSVMLSIMKLRKIVKYIESWWLRMENLQHWRMKTRLSQTMQALMR